MRLTLNWKLQTPPPRYYLFTISSTESFALFSTDNRFEISVSISLLLKICLCLGDPLFEILASLDTFIPLIISVFPISIFCMYICRLGTEPPGTTEEQVYYAKKLYSSAFHPDTGDKMNTVGRMSFQVPGGMAITGCLLQFYK